MNSFENFKKLHTGKTPLHIGNVWDTNSAIMLESKGYKALGTTSAAIASSLGYKDGENISFDDLFYVIKKIKNKISLPLTVDLEAGYSRDKNKICENITNLIELGVVGINIEDSIVTSGDREITDARDFSQIIKCIKSYLAENATDVFLNIRTDYFIMGLDNALEETMHRSRLYEEAGADGLFVPCVTDEQDIKQIVENTSLPINVMTMPDLPDFSKLQELGVKRISSGPFLYNTTNQYFNDILKAINTHQSFKPIFE